METVERAGLTNEMTFLIVSSHGYAKVQQEFQPNVVLAKKGLLTVDTKGKIIEWNAIARSFGGCVLGVFCLPSQTFAFLTER